MAQAHGTCIRGEFGIPAEEQGSSCAAVLLRAQAVWDRR